MSGTIKATVVVASVGFTAAGASLAVARRWPRTTSRKRPARAPD